MREWFEVNMSAIWRDTLIEWKERNSWVSPVSRWLRPFLNERSIRPLQRMGEQNICWDDSDWLKKTEGILRFEVEYVVERLSDALSFAAARTCHGAVQKMRAYIIGRAFA